MTDVTESDKSVHSIDQLRAALPRDDPRFLVEERCQAAGIATAWEASNATKRLYLTVAMPNGKTTRPILIGADNAKDFLETDFENVKYLGNYMAIYFSDANTIEAMLTMPHLGVTRAARLADLPGAHRVVPVGSEATEEDDRGDPDSSSVTSSERIGYDDAWLAVFDNPMHTPWKVEIGSRSSMFDRFIARGANATCIRISGINLQRHDDLVGVLERVATAALFEIELKYGIVAMLGTTRSRPGRLRRREGGLGEKSPSAPRFQYHQEALSLYSYACSAQGMPLLQYLAYYQVLEYYFPTYARREVLERLRNQLKDPGFLLQHDAHLGRLIATVKNFGSGYGNELEQLKATIRACVEEGQLRSFITEDEYMARFYDETSSIKGLRRINVADKQADIRDQAAMRIYDLRCRIVHTKDEANDKVPDLLLPFSREANSITVDIELVRYLAQKALIANAQPLQV